MFSTLVTMSLMSTLGADMALLGNTTNYTNTTYEVILEQFNSSNCSVPFQNVTYVFNCSNIHNKSWCCEEEYNKLNTSFGNAQCNRYEENDTYVHFLCLDMGGSNGNGNNGMNPYEVAGIGVVITVIFVFLVCALVSSCNRSRYSRI